MLFLLDHDVDVAVGKVLRKARHRCVTASQIGLADGSDDMVSVWADDHGAVVLTHDREFIGRRRRNTFAKHVHLACLEWDAVKVIERHLNEIVDQLTNRDALVLRVSNDGVKTYPTKWD